MPLFEEMPADAPADGSAPLFSVSSFCAADLFPARRHANHHHPYSEVFWIAAGGGEHLNDFRRFPLVAGSLVFVSIGQVHSWRLRPESRGLMAAFSPYYFPPTPAYPSPLLHLPFFLEHAARPVLAVPSAEQADFDRMFTALLREFESDGCLRDLLCRALLTELLVRACRLYPAPREKSATGRGGRRPAALALFRRFLLELETEFRRETQVQAYARRLQVSAGHLAAVVREHSGLSPAQLVDQRRLLESKRLLFNTAQTAAEIAYALGFADPAHFGRFFKRHAGESPGRARARFQETDQSFPV